ncbi:MAG: SUMF1/EgtB/PvdO family nonheme iron enzyme [Pyrinomonadaceae bacterium]
MKKNCNNKWLASIFVFMLLAFIVGTLSSAAQTGRKKTKSTATTTKTPPVKKASIPPDRISTERNVAPQPAAGSPWRSPQGIDFVFIPPGSFDMGQSNGDADAKPVHRVTISHGFYLGTTEVTQAQWKAVMGNDPSKFKGEDLPVESVSWNDVTKFILLLNAQSGGVVYRLPTEAEWEYACRAGATGPYASNLDAMAWYRVNSDDATHPVGTKKPNAWGLYDMHGNVSESVQDWKGEYRAGLQTDPKGPATGKVRVMRGGSWYSDSSFAGFAVRNYDTPVVRNYGLGFRLAAARIPVPPDQISTQPSAAPQPAAGTIWRSPQGIDFVFIPPGSFNMGEVNDDDRERPVHRVTFSQGFYLGKTEVTQAQWKAVTGDNPSGNKGDDLPVENVSWEDVTKFIRILNAQSVGLVYRLPTEAEWEYACRAGTIGPYAGDLDVMAWHKGNSDFEIHPVGTKKANAWGLYDMHGNVFEWVEDWYGPYNEGSQTDPKGPSSGPYRVMRGGSWLTDATFARSTFRFGGPPWTRSGFGFRVAAARTP